MLHDIERINDSENFFSLNDKRLARIYPTNMQWEIGCESTAKVERIGIVKNNKEGLWMTRVIFSRCAVFGSRCPFLKNCSYSQFPACS